MRFESHVFFCFFAFFFNFLSLKWPIRWCQNWVRRKVRQSEAPALNTSILFFFFLKFLVFFCVNTGENWGCLRAFLGGEAKWSLSLENVDFRDFKKIDIFGGAIFVSWNLHGSRPVRKIGIFSEKKKRKKMSKLAILGCQNYYRFDSMLAKHVKRHQYFGDFFFSLFFVKFFFFWKYF